MNDELEIDEVDVDAFGPLGVGGFVMQQMVPPKKVKQEPIKVKPTPKVNSAHAIGQQLHEYEKERAENALATVDAIRHGVMRLLDYDFMPTPAAIERALYPSENMINHFREDQ